MGIKILLYTEKIDITYPLLSFKDNLDSSFCRVRREDQKRKKKS